MASYETWFNKSIEVTGKLEGPKHFWDTKMHRLDAMVTMSSNKKKNSRIEETLSQLPPKRDDTILARRNYRNKDQTNHLESSNVGDTIEGTPARQSLNDSSVYQDSSYK